MEFNRVLAENDFIDEVPCGNCEPIVGVVKLVRPIELGVQAQQGMKQEQWNLSMAILIEGSKSGHCSPGAVAAKPRAPQVAYDSGELRQRQCRRVYLQTVQPRQGQLLHIFDAPYRIAHGLYRHV